MNVAIGESQNVLASGLLEAFKGRRGVTNVLRVFDADALFSATTDLRKGLVLIAQTFDKKGWVPVAQTIFKLAPEFACVIMGDIYSRQDIEAAFACRIFALLPRVPGGVAPAKPDTLRLLTSG